MSRRLPLRWIGLICALAVASGLPSRAGEPAMKAVPVSASAWYVQGGAGMASQANRGFMSNAGFVVTDEGVVVFDALATPVLAEELLALIRATTDRPVRHVVVSHYHADHVYGLQVFKAAGARIWAREEGREYLASEQARERLAQRRRELAPWVDARTNLVAADHWIGSGSGETSGFTLGSMRFELLSGGNSHTRGDLMLWIPGERVLFAGDLFFTQRLPFVVDGNTREWLGALDRIEAIRAAVVVPGHGAASRAVGADLALTRDYLRELRRSMGGAVEALETFEEAFARIDASRFASLPTFEAAHRRNAHSVYLEMQAEALGSAGP